MRKETLYTICITLLCTGVVIFAATYGKNARSYANSPQAHVINEPHEALQIWERAGVRGRTLLLFDRHLNADSGAPPNESYVDSAIKKNVVRRIFHIVPGAAWQDVERVLSGSDAFTFNNGVYRMVFQGVPVTVMRLQDIAPLAETVLIAVNGSPYQDDELRRLGDLIGQGVVRSDMIIWSGRLPAGPVMERIGLHARADR